MDRFFVPRLGFVAVLALATLLIGIALRGPDTNGNLWREVPPSYTRTSVILLSGEVTQEAPPARIALSLPAVTSGDARPMNPDRRAYVQAGCATCHGLNAEGGPVAPPLAGAVPDVVKRMVREGRGGMPVYTEKNLSDADVNRLTTYLQGLEVVRPESEQIAVLQRLTHDPAVSTDVLLRGKAAIRRSCGACHAQPGREDILKAFDSDAKAAGLVAEMVQETNLSLEDAKAIAHYMLAIRNGVDPVKQP